MKIPISKQLADNLILPCFAFTAVGAYDLISGDGKRFEQNILILLIWGIPTVLLGWLLFDKRVEFREIIRSRQAARWIKLPLSSSSSLIFFSLSSLFIFGGLFSFFDANEDRSSALFMFLGGLFTFILFVLASEHPKIWFSDSYNLKDSFEEFQRTPKEDQAAYQNGIFTYNSDQGFTMVIENEERYVLWVEIENIRAFKVDRYTVDSIVIEIDLKEHTLIITDETNGYMKFMDTAQSKLKNFKEDWFMTVAFPPFEKNLTFIYKKEI